MEYIVAVRAVILIPAATAILGLFVIISVIFDRNGNWTFDTFVRPWAKLSLWLAGARLKVHDQAELTENKGPFIVVFNHQSNMDIFTLVASLPLQIRYLGKQAIGRIPFFGEACRRIGCIFIDRSDHSSGIEGIAKATAYIKDNNVSFVIAPEGTRSPDGNMLPFKKGAFVMAIDMGLPILPLSIKGTHDILPKGSSKASAGDVEVMIHPPVYTDGMTYDDRDLLSVRVREMMSAFLGS